VVFTGGGFRLEQGLRLGGKKAFQDQEEPTNEREREGGILQNRIQLKTKRKKKASKEGNLK